MFNIGWSEVLVILAVGVLFLRPQDIPRLARKIGRIVGQIKEYMETVSQDVQQDVKKLESESDLPTAEDTQTRVGGENRSIRKEE